MIASSALLALMVALGGVIAYLGDLLGRKMGKKRLRIGKLRPRYTATVLTVLVGALLPVATTFALATISRDVRAYLVRGPELAREARQLGEQLEGLRETREQLLRRNEEIESDSARLRAESATLLSANQALTEDQERLRAESDALKQDVQVANQRLATAETRLVRVETRRDELQQDVSELQQQTTQLREDIRRYQEDTLTLVQEAIQAERQKEEAERARDDAMATRDALYNEITDLQTTLLRVRQEMADLIRGIEAVRTSDVLFHRNEELARLAIPGGLDRARAEQVLTQVLRVAEIRARERGVLPDQRGVAAGMVDWQRLVGEGPPITISVQDQKDSLFQAIRSAQDDLVMLARSHYNYFSIDSGRRPVPIRVDVFLNRIVFREDEVIATTVLDGRLSEDELVDGLMEFLRNDVRRRAEEAGMIPVHGLESSLGEVTFEQMANLVDAVRARGGPTTIAAVAAQTTRSAEALRLRFEVR
ncbi:MAG: DUF3084 domain-containing protein [Armatimonadota bacterium]